MIRPTLLLVDDERIIAFDLARRLTTLGYTVLATAGSGREAIQQAVDLRPDLVLMDVGLPGGMDGLEAAAHIRSQAAIPISRTRPALLRGRSLPASRSRNRSPIRPCTRPSSSPWRPGTRKTRDPRCPKDAAARTVAPSLLPAGTSRGPRGQNAS